MHRRGLGGFFRGSSLVFRGFRLYSSSPGLTILGMIPPIIMAVIFIGILTALAFVVGPLTDVLLAFANDWAEGARIALRVVVIVAIIGGSGILLALSFTALTLAIGAPFYDVIAERVDTRLGAEDTASIAWWRGILRGLRDSAALIALAAGTAVGLFLIGLIPAVGSVIAAIVGAIVGGWLIAAELSGVAGERRGLSLGQRLRLLRGGTATTLGFGVTVFLLFLLPLGAVIVMPAAVSGATLLIRDLRGEPIDRRSTAPATSERR